MTRVPVLQSEPSLRLATRMAILACVTAVAYAGRNVLGTVESVAGALCAVQCSLLLPTLFFMAVHVKHKRMRVQHWLGLGAMLLFGALLVVLTVAEALAGALHMKPLAQAAGTSLATHSPAWHWIGTVPTEL